MTNVNKLHNAVKILDQIKKLDSEIIEIEKIAQTVANGNSLNVFNLQIQDSSAKIGTGKNILDSDGSLRSGFENPMEAYRKMFGGGTMGIWERMSSMEEPKKPQFTHELTNEISESTVLGILGILLFDKQEHRNRLINNLKRKGFQL